MNDQRTNLEIIAPTVDEAIEKGLGDLGLPRDSVDIEILDEGGKGLFGLGNRQARVRLTIKSDSEEPEPIAMDEHDPSEAVIFKITLLRRKWLKKSWNTNHHF